MKNSLFSPTFSFDALFFAIVFFFLFIYSANAFRIGGSGSGFYNGSIDELRVWNRSLGIDEINQLYMSNLIKYNTTHWEFYTNQSKNATAGLENGTYTYRIFGKSLAGNENLSEKRTLTIGAAANTLPTVTLVDPVDGNKTADRTPVFTWTGSDNEGDPLTYEINISPVLSSLCTDSDRYITGISAQTYTLLSDLKCLYDNNDYYLWSVRANDGTEYGSWATYRKINVTAVIDIALPTNSVNFGQISFQGSNDTTSNYPNPFVVRNDGNSFINISVSATSLWNTIANPNNYYKYKADNVSGENRSFDSARSIIAFNPMPLTGSGSNVSISKLNYSDATDSAELDIFVQVPSSNEGSSVRSSTVTFTGSLAE